MKPKSSDIKSYYCTVLLLCLSLCYSQNKTPIADQLAQQLQTVSVNQPQDIVYLQTSKTIYETEEDVWFKAYVLDAQDFTPSNRNKTLFVQLIGDKTDSIVWEKKYEIENGFVDGHLFLKNELAEGTYSLSAYSSNSFIKEQKEFYALKKITVVKTITEKKPLVPVEKDSIVHFATFPEGGKMVSGIQSRLAFKTVNSKGLPVDVSGTLFENNIPLLSFKSSHAGMGSFDFTPNESKKYHIELSEPKSVSKKKYDIATIETSGKSIRLINTTNEEVIFKISQTKDSKPEKVFLRLQLQGVVYSIATGILKKELVIKIPISDVPRGIAEVTLFTENGIAVAERLVFVKHDQNLRIQTELNKSEFTTREKANLKIKVTDENGQGIVAHLGLSVYDAIYQNKADAKNIQTHYLLSTQLKGNIYNPAYYFDQKNKDRKEALDLLLLTQGWRYYVWNEDHLKELGNNTKIVFDDIKGKVQLTKTDKKAIANDSNPKAITLFAADESKGKDFMMTDPAGLFTIGPKDLKKGAGGYTYMQLMTPEKPKYQMHIKEDSFKQIDSVRKSKTFIYPLAAIEKLNQITISPFKGRLFINKLNEVVIISKKKGEVFRDKYIGKLDSLAKYNATKNDYVDEFGGWMLPGCGTRRPREGEWVTVYKDGRVVPCDNRPKFTMQEVNHYQYRYPTFTEEELLTMFNIASVVGYYGKKVFYESVYDEVTLMDSTPDFRNTLFWKSDIITDKNGEASVDFFCSDINSLFIGTIEGVNDYGLLGSENIEFKVRKREN